MNGKQVDSAKHLFIASSLGFCNGVRHALEVVESLLASGGGAALYVLHEIVHNNFVVSDLKKRGVIFVSDPDEVPDGGTLVLSAHGTAPDLVRRACARLRVEDATCPLVRRVQNAAARACRKGERMILFGHRGHPEVEGIIGHASGGMLEVAEKMPDLAHLAPDDGRKVCILSQTTLDSELVAAMAETLRKRFRDTYCGAGICYATQERQKAVRELARQVEYMVILGSPGSSNSNRLREAAEREGVSARLADSPEDIPPEELSGVHELGLSAGASVPEALISRTVEYLQKWGFQLQRGKA